MVNETVPIASVATSQRSSSIFVGTDNEFVNY